MTLRLQYCNSESDGEIETMLFVILEDESGKEKMRMPFYLAADAKKLLPELSSSFNELPSLLQMIYKSGLNKEKLNIIQEHINMQ